VWAAKPLLKKSLFVPERKDYFLLDREKFRPLCGGDGCPALADAVIPWAWALL
jgi:hypothetical protein